MTNQELNRDIKRLYKAYKSKVSENTSNWTHEDWRKYENQENAFKKEFQRLYYADRNFDVLNATTLKMMISLNNSLRVVAFHVFGQIEIKL